MGDGGGDVVPHMSWDEACERRGDIVSHPKARHERGGVKSCPRVQRAVSIRAIFMVWLHRRGDGEVQMGHLERKVKDGGDVDTLEKFPRLKKSRPENSPSRVALPLPLLWLPLSRDTACVK